MYDCLIPLGQTCNITLLLQNAKLKKQTSLFEWFVSKRLNNITNVLRQIIDHLDGDIIKTSGSHVYISDSNIFSGHYKYEEFIEIYKRRRDRLLETIRTSKTILFTRFEGSELITYTHKDIDDFIEVIMAINPTIEKITIMLISNNPIQLNHPSVVQVFYNKHTSDPYCKSVEINTIFMDELKRIGYNIEDTTNDVFTDKSAI